MIELTKESLEKLILDFQERINTIALKPTKLIAPPATYRRLMYRTPVKKSKGIRGRKRALYGRSNPLMWRLMRS